MNSFLVGFLVIMDRDFCVIVRSQRNINYG